jgi:hypothetical protein
MTKDRKKYIFNNLILAIVLISTACGPFDTRNPEEPETGGAVFLPQTSWEAVITNLERSFVSLATENYIQALAEDPQFNFIPSAEATNSFQGIFEDWSVSGAERRWFLTMRSNIPEGLSPDLTLYPAAPQSFADSVIYTAGYTLNIPHQADNVANQFKGRLQFTISRDEQANWRISSWIDQSSDSTLIPEIPTFSHLKAGFFN